MLEGDLARGLVDVGVGLDEDLAGLLVAQDLVADLAAPELRVDLGHAEEEAGAALDVRRRLVDVQLLEVGADGLAARRQDLGPVEADLQVREVVRPRVLELAEVAVARLQEALQDAETRLRVRLPPLLAFRIPHFQRRETGPRHREVRRVEDVAGRAVDVDRPVAEPEDLEHRELAAEVHGDELGAAFLVRAGHAAEDGPPSLARSVPRCHGLSCDG